MKKQASLVLDVCPQRNQGNICPAFPKVNTFANLMFAMLHGCAVLNFTKAHVFKHGKDSNSLPFSAKCML